MDRSSLNALAREMLALHDERIANPERRPAQRIDLRHYTDADQFSAERRILFGDTPLMLGFSADLPHVGSVKTNDYLDTPILLVRTADGIKAFANICPHRGGRLVDEPTCLGTRKALTCRYHGWVFGLDGRLKHVQDAHLFGEIDRSASGLIELSCDERHGMIFVRPKPGAPVSIRDRLGGELDSELAGWNFQDLHFVDATTFDTQSNWKLQLDTFFESYHVQSLHSATIAPLSLSGYMLRRDFGLHQRLVFAAATLPEIREQPDEALNGHKHLTIVHMIFPNIFIVQGPLWIQYFEVYPGDAIDHQRTRFALYARRPPETEAQRDAGKAYFGMSVNFVGSEDYLMGLQVTRGVMSGLPRHHLLGHAESAIVHFHRMLRREIGLDPDAVFAPACEQKSEPALAVSG